MILLGLIEVIYSASSGFLKLCGADFTMPARLSEVWSYALGLLQNGKAIIGLFLDLPYLYNLITYVTIAWGVLLMCELLTFVLKLVKLSF